MSRLIIITGGPGSGKTTLLEYIRMKGYNTFDEVPRQLISHQLKQVEPILPWIDLSAFANLCFIEMDKQRDKANELDIAFVDRAIGDILAYLYLGNIDPEERYLNEAVKGYYKTVYLLKPNKSIYVQDEVRPHTFEEALIIHKKIRDVYISLGYSLCEIPYLTSDVQFKIIQKGLSL